MGLLTKIFGNPEGGANASSEPHAAESASGTAAADAQDPVISAYPRSDGSSSGVRPAVEAAPGRARDTGRAGGPRRPEHPRMYLKPPSTSVDPSVPGSTRRQQISVRPGARDTTRGTPPPPKRALDAHERGERQSSARASERVIRRDRSSEPVAVPTPLPPALRPKTAMVVSPVSLTQEDVQPGARPKMPTLLGLGAAMDSPPSYGGATWHRSGRASGDGASPGERRASARAGASGDVERDGAAPAARGRGAPGQRQPGRQSAPSNSLFRSARHEPPHAASPAASASSGFGALALEAGAEAPDDLDVRVRLLADFALKLSLGPISRAWLPGVRRSVDALLLTGQHRNETALVAVSTRLLELLQQRAPAPGAKITAPKSSPEAVAALGRDAEATASGNRPVEEAIDAGATAAAPAAGANASSSESSTDGAVVGVAADPAATEAAHPEASIGEATVPQAAVPQAAVSEAAVSEAALPEAAVSEAALPEAAVPQGPVSETAVPQAAASDTSPGEPQLPEARTEAPLAEDTPAEATPAEATPAEVTPAAPTTLPTSAEATSAEATSAEATPAEAPLAERTAADLPPDPPRLGEPPAPHPGVLDAGGEPSSAPSDGARHAAGDPNQAPATNGPAVSSPPDPASNSGPLEGALRENILHELSRLAGVLPEWPEAAQDLAEEARRREARVLRELLAQVDGLRREQRARLEEQMRLEELASLSPEAIGAEIGAPVERASELLRVLGAYRQERLQRTPDVGNIRGLSLAIDELERRCDAFDDCDPERREALRLLREDRRQALGAVNLLLAERGELDWLDELEPLALGERVERLKQWRAGGSERTC